MNFLAPQKKTIQNFENPFLPLSLIFKTALSEIAVGFDSSENPRSERRNHLEYEKMKNVLLQGHKLG